MTDRPFIHTVERLATIVQTKRKDLGITIQELAQISGVDIEFLKDIESCTPRSETGKILRVLKALGLKPRAIPTTTQWAFDQETGKLKDKYQDFQDHNKTDPRLD